MKPNHDPLDTFIGIETAAHEGAFGDNPQLPPTTGQLAAGNYKKGRISLYGLPIAIENPRNSYRTGTDADGKPWRNRMAAHYGYFVGTVGADNDPIDCFVGFYPQSEAIYIINQHLGGSFDEHKAMLCFPDEDTARRAYLDSYDRGWQGLHSLVTASITQFKWWLRQGDHQRPVSAKTLPYDGFENMKRTYWDATGLPLAMTLDGLIYDIRRHDAEGLLLDSLAMADIMEDGDNEVMVLDAMVIPFARLEVRMSALQKVMNRTQGDIKALAFQISDPFKSQGVAQVAVIFELSDGQTVTIFFHNPDVTPQKITATDELISWKWMQNKKDVTVVVAPEKGVDLNVREVAVRIMRLIGKNSKAFQKANAGRAERMQRIQGKKDQIVGLEKTLADRQRELEVAQLERDEWAANPPQAAQAPAEPVAIADDPATDPVLPAQPIPINAPTATADNQEATKHPIGYNGQGEIEFAYNGYKAYAMQPDVSGSVYNPDANVLASKIIPVTTQFSKADRETYPGLPAKTSAWRISAVATKTDGSDIYIRYEYADGDGMTDSGRLKVNFVQPDSHLLDGMERIAPSVHKAGLEMFEALSDQSLLGGDGSLPQTQTQTQAAGIDDNPPQGLELEPDGADNEVKTAKGTKVVTGFMVVEASSLIISHDEQGNANPDYPAELQPRDRSRDTSQAQIARIARNLDPDMLGRTRVAYQGAPIVGKDGVVESGNGRAMAITLAYQLGKADEYRAWLLEVADMYGLDKAKIEAMQQPVLVRVRKTDIDRVRFAMESNQSDMLAMTGTEKAKSDANRLTDAVIGRLSIDGDLTAASNRDFIMAFLQSLGDDETAGLLTTSGQPTKQLYDRAQAAIFAKAYNDDRLLELMADDSKPEIGNIIKSLNQAARPFIRARAISDKVAHDSTQKLGDAIEMSLDQQAVDAIVKATEMLKKAKDSGMAIEELVKQGDMFGDTDPVVAQMALFIKANNRSAARMGVAFEAMAAFVLNELENRLNNSLFVDDPLIDMVDVLKAANAQLQRQYGDGANTIGGGIGGFIDLFTETRGQAKDREEFLQHQGNPEPIQDTQVEPTPIERVDAAYLFADASDSFKEWLAESLNKPDDSPFVTAKAMDEAAKRHGAGIEWGFFGGAPDADAVLDDASMVEVNQFKEGDHVVNTGNNHDMTVTHQKGYKVYLLGSNGWIHANQLKYANGKKPKTESMDEAFMDDVNQDGYVGKISKDNVIVGRIDMRGDGNAMVFVGETGDKRVEFEQGREAMYSDDDAPLMIDWLFGNLAAIQDLPVPEVNGLAVVEPANPVIEAPLPATDIAPVPPEPLAQTVPAIDPEIDGQKRKLQGLVELQTRMKAVNKIVKNKKLDEEAQKAALTAAGFGAEVGMVGKPDWAGDFGYAGYQLTNNNAVIRNTEKRIAELEARNLAASKAESGDRETSYGFDGGTVDLDYADDRLRINFDTKPDADMIARLKQNGFKWSPTNTAWQRQLTDNAISSANRLLGTAIQSAASVMHQKANAPRTGIVPAPVPPVPVVDEKADKLAGFTAELDALGQETDIQAFDQRLDEIVARIETDGLMGDLDAKLNETTDVLTFLLAEAERKAA